MSTSVRVGCLMPFVIKCAQTVLFFFHTDLTDCKMANERYWTSNGFIWKIYTKYKVKIILLLFLWKKNCHILIWRNIFTFQSEQFTVTKTSLNKYWNYFISPNLNFQCFLTKTGRISKLEFSVFVFFACSFIKLLNLSFITHEQVLLP